MLATYSLLPPSLVWACEIGSLFILNLFNTLLSAKQLILGGWTLNLRRIMLCHGCMGTAVSREQNIGCQLNCVPSGKRLKSEQIYSILTARSVFGCGAWGMLPPCSPIFARLLRNREARRLTCIFALVRFMDFERSDTLRWHIAVNISLAVQLEQGRGNKANFVFVGECGQWAEYSIKTSKKKLGTAFIAMDLSVSNLKLQCLRLWETSKLPSPSGDSDSFSTVLQNSLIFKSWIESGDGWALRRCVPFGRLNYRGTFLMRIFDGYFG